MVFYLTKPFVNFLSYLNSFFSSCIKPPQTINSVSQSVTTWLEMEKNAHSFIFSKCFILFRVIVYLAPISVTLGAWQE